MTGHADAERADLLAALTDTPRRLREALPPTLPGTVPPSRSRGEEWTPHEVVRHLIASERDVFQARLAQLAAGSAEEPRWSWVEPAPDEASAALALDQLLDMFAAARAETIARASALDEAAWARCGLHATLGRLDAAGLLRVAAEHDESHLADLGSRQNG